MVNPTPKLAEPEKGMKMFLFTDKMWKFIFSQKKLVISVLPPLALGGIMPQVG